MKQVAELIKPIKTEIALPPPFTPENEDDKSFILCRVRQTKKTEEDATFYLIKD
jgi:hypothetical protein